MRQSLIGDDEWMTSEKLSNIDELLVAGWEITSGALHALEGTALIDHILKVHGGTLPTSKTNVLVC